MRKIINLKELAIDYNLAGASSFNGQENKTERYLEYVMSEIDDQNRNNFKFRQFLFLIDVLYVILDDEGNNLTSNKRSGRKRKNNVTTRDNSTYDLDNVKASMAVDLESVEKGYAKMSDELEGSNLPWENK